VADSRELVVDRLSVPGVELCWASRDRASRRIDRRQHILAFVPGTVAHPTGVLANCRYHHR
jgi:hypothetical protein